MFVYDVLMDMSQPVEDLELLFEHEIADLGFVLDHPTWLQDGERFWHRDPRVAMYVTLVKGQPMYHVLYDLPDDNDPRNGMSWSSHESGSAIHLAVVLEWSLGLL